MVMGSVMIIFFLNRLNLLNDNIPILHQETQDAFNRVMESFITSGYQDFLAYYRSTLGFTDVELNPAWTDPNYLAVYNQFTQNMEVFVSTLRHYTDTVERTISLLHVVQEANPYFRLNPPSLTRITVTPEE